MSAPASARSELRNEVVGHKVTDRDMFKRADQVVDTVLAPFLALVADLEKGGNQVYAWDVAERLRSLIGGDL